MKLFKKLAAIVLAATMVLAMGMTAMAAVGDYTITIDNSASENSSIDGKQYKAYKVFELTLGDATTTGTGDDAVTTYGAYAYSISNTAWAWNTLIAGASTDDKGVITTVYGIKLTPSASDPSKYVVDGETMTEANARSLADALAKVLPDTADGTSSAADNETATIELSDPGYYAVYGVVYPTDPSKDPAEEVVAALALTTTDPDATVKPKAEVPPLDKKITGQHVLDDDGKAATAQVGSKVSFELDSSVPDLTGYTKYTFIIGDTLSSGLTFDENSVKVSIGGTELTSGYTLDTTDDDYTFTVTIPFDTLKAAKKGDAIVVTYDATLNENALTTDYENNTAKLTYSRSPYNDEENETPEKEVYVIDVNIDVDKVAGSSAGSKLAGAEFKLFKGSTLPADTDEAWYQYDATAKAVKWVAKADSDTFTTGTNGKLTTQVQGLEAEKTGTQYGLLETKAPTGYNPLPNPIIVTLTGTYTESSEAKTATITATGASVENGTVNLAAAQTDAQPVASPTVINNAGTELPSTGGIGTTIFYVVGAMLVLGAGVLLVTRRRMSAK